ncbi:MAG: glycosyltransferase family 39 protein [Anaerolineaceae bacterium]|nr:glycosyltransferase family 39 protein [Anaerolineaceae bacterium]MCB9101356.1 glycosyltransferase family 39 protein [Anaerolineales bacterium]
MVINNPDHKFNKLVPPAAIGLILLLAFFLRTYQLDHQALRGDEAATVLYSAMPISELWELSRVTDPHPPLYYLLLHLWQTLIGEEAWVMRFAGVIAGTLTVAALYALAQRTVRNAAVSLLAAALLAVNPLQIWLAQDVRSYPLFTLLGLLSSWALWAALTGDPPSAIRRQPSTLNRESQSLANSLPQQPTYHALRTTRHVSRPILWLLYIGLTVACLYTHYYTVFLIAFQGLFVLLNAKKFWTQRWPWLISQIAIGLLITPGLQLAYNFIGPAAGGIEKLPTTNILRLASTALLTGFTIDDHWGLLISLILTPIWLFGIVSLLRRNFTTGIFWTLFFATPVFGVIILSIDRPFFKERFLIQAQPAFELLVAAGLVTLFFSAKMPLSRARSPRPAPLTTFYTLRVTSLLLLAFLLYVNLLALTHYFTDIAYAKAPPWHLYHNYISKKLQPGDVMLTNFPEASVSYYSPNGLPFYVVPVERDRSTEFRLAETEKIANAYQRIWFLPLLRQGFDEQGDVLNWLDRHADRVDQVFFPDYNLNLYLGPAAIDAQLIHQPVTFTHGIELRGFQILDKTGQSRLVSTGEIDQEYRLNLEPEDEFTLSLYWLAGGPTEAPYTVFTHLIAADGFNRVGQDNQPVWGTYPTSNWSPGEKITDKYTLTIPAGAPAGDHRLQIGWYQSDTQERVPVLDKAGQPGQEFIILNAIIRVEQRSSLAKD